MLFSVENDLAEAKALDGKNVLCRRAKRGLKLSESKVLALGIILWVERPRTTGKTLLVSSHKINYQTLRRAPHSLSQFCIKMTSAKNDQIDVTEVLKAIQ